MNQIPEIRKLIQTPKNTNRDDLDYNNNIKSKTRNWKRYKTYKNKQILETVEVNRIMKLLRSKLSKYQIEHKS